MFAPMKFMSGSKLGHSGLKIRSPGQIKEDIVDILKLHFLTNHHESRSKCLWWFIGQVRNARVKKLGHQDKSKENLVNTPEVTFLIIKNISQNVYLDDF